MNRQMVKERMVMMLVFLVLALSACGTFEVEMEPTVSVVEPGSDREEPPLAAPLPAVTEVVALAERRPTPSESPVATEAAVGSIQPPDGDSKITHLDGTWNQFTDQRLGFSIRFPNQMATFRGSCVWNEQQGSYRPEPALVPVKIFEDVDAVFIAAQHYFELAGERAAGGVSYYDECNLIANSLELLRDPDNRNEPFWKLVVKEIRDDGELDHFIKARYGSGCSLGEQIPSSQDGVYDVKIVSDGKDLAQTQCPLNFMTVVKYFPAADKLIAWDRGQSYYFPADVDYSLTCDDEMTASFRFLSDTDAELEGAPLATTGYGNSENGISFDYPASWTMEEEAHAFVFRSGTVHLRVGYRLPGDTSDHGGRSGMGGTDVVVMEGTVPFLDQSLAKHGVWYFDDALIAVIYGGPPGTTVQAGGIAFTIILEDPDSDYQTETLTGQILAEAEMILASFAVASSEGSPVSGLNRYGNGAYGFSLNYPPTWTAAEVNGEAFVGPGSRSVQFSRGPVTLVIGYRRAGESAATGGSGAPGGEFDIRGSVAIAGEDVDRYVIVYQGKDKVVMYGQPGPPPLSAGDLEFAASLHDFNPDYDYVELSQADQEDADLIMSSLTIIPSGSGAPDAPTGYDTTGWQTYRNEAAGYSLMIPGDAQIVSQDPGQRVAFIGPEVDGKPRYQWMVEQYMANYPEGTDFKEPLLAGHRAFLDSLGVDEEGMIEALTIAGEPAIRTRHPGTSAADQPRDDFYFMHGEMMFQISITLFGGVEDTALTSQFLSSLIFAPSS
jgi:hypothetical protein